MCGDTALELRSCERGRLDHDDGRTARPIHGLALDEDLVRREQFVDRPVAERAAFLVAADHPLDDGLAETRLPRRS
jgi:hypothetical protein